jgi:Zn-dependent peptidase ImmA (M78 family)
VLDSASLYGLLGVKESEIEHWVPPMRSEAAVAVPRANNELKIVPRKKHPVAKRFEFARFIGDYLYTNCAGDQWLATTDLRTSRQKFQRAFAAEFLCPINSLQEFLDGDYSETAIEDAAHHFDVSIDTVSALLANNGLIQLTPFEAFPEARLPYPTGA